MKERPINFTDDEVGAVLADRKTQKRFIIKPQPELTYRPELYTASMLNEYEWRWRYDDGHGCQGVAETSDGLVKRACPFGKPGDHLRVREAFRSFSYKHLANHDVKYPIHKHAPHYSETIVIYRESGARMPEHFYEDGYGQWSPAVQMPRWASRITLEIESVRVERLQEISEADARAEGMTAKTGRRVQTCREAYQEGWDGLNAKRGFTWESNPWVWVITFKRLEVGR